MSIANTGGASGCTKQWLMLHEKKGGGGMQRFVFFHKYCTSVPRKLQPLITLQESAHGYVVLYGR